ncbi:MAG: class II aldolase/adducin family protein [Kiritimatiellae bacterium]|nr:class II aldolase/adducin family protein [Kiritimatiellia bacterium]
MLDIIARLSQEFGQGQYVMGGGGNSSCKDAATLWIKPSGTTLAKMTAKSFIAMDRARLARLYELAAPADATAREALVKDTMETAIKPETPGRASVEAPVHNAFEARFVVHTHPTLANGLTCSLGGPAAAARLFPGILWISYVDPGYSLAMRVRRELAEFKKRHGREPRMMWLENHDVFIAGDSADEIRAGYGEVIASMTRAYAEAGVDTALSEGVAPSTARVAEVKARLQVAFGKDAASVLAGGPVLCAAGPISPDHLVYAKSFVYEGTLEVEALRAYMTRRGYAPRVASLPDGLYGFGPSDKVAGLALAFARDAARIRHLARAFGGIQYMTDAARDFLEHWEVETYREKQV